MKRKAWIVSLVLGFMLSGSMAVYAEDVPTVLLTPNDEITYENCADNQFGNTFEGMAPGDSRTQVIKIENRNAHEASFFLSEQTLITLEEANEAAGGVYTMQLSVGKTQKDAQVLLDTVTGGYEDASNATDEGLKGITALEDFTYLAELGSGEETNVYLTIALNGEGMDSTSVVDYTDALATLAFQFRAYYGNEAEPVVITRIVDQEVPLSALVETGDQAPIIILGAMLTIGVFLIIVVIKRRKGGYHEKENAHI